MVMEPRRKTESGGEGVVRVKEDDNGSWMLVGEEVNFSHSGGGGS